MAEIGGPVRTLEERCRNCGAALTGPFCAQCGQSAKDHRRPLVALLTDAADAFLSYDPRTLRSARLLLTRPGEITRWYNDGRRQSLMPPLRLYLVALVLFFLTLWASGIALMQVTIPPDAELEAAIGDGTMSIGPSAVGGELQPDVAFLVPKPSLVDVHGLETAGIRVLDQDGVTPEERARAERFLSGLTALLRDPRGFNDLVNDWLPRILIVMVPLLAFVLSWFYWRPKRYLAEHLVFSLHLHTAFFVLATAVLAGVWVLQNSDWAWIAWPVFGIYAIAAFRSAYRQGWIVSVLKAAAATVFYIVLFSAAFSGALALGMAYV